MSDEKQGVEIANVPDDLAGDWSVWSSVVDGSPEMLEGDLPEEIARQMVADYAAEGETVWMERTATAPE